jgi:hypothetical protein
MYNLQEFLQDLKRSTGIKFDLIGDDGSIIFTGSDGVRLKDITPTTVELGKQIAYLYVPCELEGCTSLLKYTIESKCKDASSERQQIVCDILDGKIVAADRVERNLDFIGKGCTLFVVDVNAYRYEALTVLKQIYNDQDVTCTIYGDNIIVLGVFDEVSEHAESIKESINSDTYCKCIVSYGDVFFDVDGMKKAYRDAVGCIVLGSRFGMKNDIFSYNRMMFEKIVYNISPAVKEELLKRFGEKLNLFDSEIVTTIEEFVNCGLNITDAARKLYVHRNTLIYRLDKINKETGFDIRNFREATVFIIAFLIWKESSK